MATSQIYLHIGLPKTGTTYLQEVLWANRRRLRAAGLLYPGLSTDAHFHATMDLISEDFHGHRDPVVRGAWHRLVDEARAWTGSVVISHELLSSATAAQIDRALSSLSFGQVHLVCTARDLARQIPAVWQEDIKNRQSHSFAEFASSVARGPFANDGPGAAFWHRQDLLSVLQKWSTAIPPERVHVVTLPPPGAPAAELWTRFAGVLGLDPGRWETTVRGHNRSMGTAGTALLRRVNRAVGDRLDWPAYATLVKHELATEIINDYSGVIPITLPEEDQPWAREQAERVVRALHESEYHVAGEVKDLLSDLSHGPAGQRHPDDVTEAEVAELAVYTIAELLLRRARFEPPARGADRIRRAIDQLAEQQQAAQRLRELYRRVKIRLVHAETRWFR